MREFFATPFLLMIHVCAWIVTIITGKTYFFVEVDPEMFNNDED